VPFVRGGAEVLAEALATQLREHGHSVELVRLPFLSYPPEKVLEHMLAARMIRLAAIDRVIGFKFPAYLVPHEDKVMWILHQHRSVYDLWGTELQDGPDTVEARALRQAIIDADNRYLPAARRLFVISNVNAERMRRFNDLDPEILYPPLPSPEAYRTGETGDYLFFPSRITSFKRQALAAAAMRHVRSGVRLVIAGQPDYPWSLQDLQKVTSNPDLQGRVDVRAGWMPEDVKLDLYANCLGVLFPPRDEDYGYVTLESFLSGKPVITCSDSGGPLELIEDGVSGFVVAPDPVALADAIDRLASDRRRARDMGAAARERARTLDISWDRVVAELTA
jgi:glycosyltransferase involved in cell wall biosynthesis